jgi:polyisoprenoid-binding protein YceI
MKYSILLITALWAGMAAASRLKVEGQSEFVAVGKPGFIKIHGQGEGLKGELVVAGNKVSGELIFPVGELNTGVGLRDRHMKDEFLEAGKYPEVKLVLKEVALPADPEKNGFKQTQIPFTGTLTVRGISKPLTGTIDLATDAGKTHGDARFEVKMSDFGFRKAEYLGLKVEDAVQVKAHLEAKKKS